MNLFGWGGVGGGRKGYLRRDDDGSAAEEARCGRSRLVGAGWGGRWGRNEFLGAVVGPNSDGLPCGGPRVFIEQVSQILDSRHFKVRFNAC